MTKRRNTKRALLSSVVALLLCFSMLLGSTFAWFTDSAVSGNNIIQAGNLDMKLSYKPYGAENTEWTEVTESTVLFGEDALYEPGYTEAVWLKVENLGSLAFRYDLAINVAGEKQGTNKAGEKFSLSDYLEVKYMTTTSTDMESNYYTTRESLDSFNWGGVANSGVAAFNDDIAVIKNGVAFSKDDATNGAYSSAYVLVVISMPTSVTNEANHNGTNIPEINFALTAVATQLAYEKDSFGSDYDANATYPDVKIKKTIEIDPNIERTEVLGADAGEAITVNGNDGTLKVNGAAAIETKGGDLNVTDLDVKAGSPDNYAVIISNGNATFKNVDIDSEGGGVGVANGAKVDFDGDVDVSTASTSGRYNFYVVDDGSELTINNGEFTFSKTLNQKRAYIYVGSGATVYVKGGKFGPASTRSGYTEGIMGNGTVIITGGTFGFDPTAWVAEGYQVIKNDNVYTVVAK